MDEPGGSPGNVPSGSGMRWRPGCCSAIGCGTDELGGSPGNVPSGSGMLWKLEPRDSIIGRGMDEPGGSPGNVPSGKGICPFMLSVCAEGLASVLEIIWGVFD